VEDFQMPNLTRRPPMLASIILGLGLGGFGDGILLHQVLQWHHMLSSAGFPPDSLANLQVNTLWDGLFHTSTWILTVVGLFTLWQAFGRRETPWSTKTFLGGLAAGWGIFDVVEGVIDHEILGIHHVNETVPRAQWIWWDLGFLAFGVLLVVIGWSLFRAGRADDVPVPREPELVGDRARS
jgi:uncharacterized membrane protein